MKTEYASETNRRIAEARKNMGYTQQEAADLMNMKRNTYARMERLGNPTISELKMVSELFKVSADWLLYGDKGVYCTFASLLQPPRRPQRLHSPSNPFSEYLPFLPSRSELNILKVIHILAKPDQQRVFDFVDGLYQTMTEEKMKKRLQKNTDEK